MKLIGVRIPSDLKGKLQKIADSQHRPLSNPHSIDPYRMGLKNTKRKPMTNNTNKISSEEVYNRILQIISILSEKHTAEAP